MRSNPRVKLPKHRSTKEETELMGRQLRAEELTEEYLSGMETDAKNMTPGEYRGMKKIKKRVQNKEVVIYQTDKSGLMAVATMESYRHQGEKHVSGDKEVQWEEVVS